MGEFIIRKIDDHILEKVIPYFSSNVPLVGDLIPISESGMKVKDRPLDGIYRIVNRSHPLSPGSAQGYLESKTMEVFLESVECDVDPTEERGNAQII